MRDLGITRQRRTLAETAHRPWALPDAPWIMGQTWEQLLFAHWRVPAEALRRVIPPQLEVDLHEGEAWLGVTPFVVRNLRMRGTPPPPVVSYFPEINVRTYVRHRGEKPGIWFFSLDTARMSGVLAARRGYRLPYFRASMSVRVRGDRVAFESRRTQRDGPPATFRAEYGAAGPPLPVRDGSLERWLAERYCLYTLDAEQRVHRGDIHHPPWPLLPAIARIEENTMARQIGIELEGDPLLHLAPRQDVLFWARRCG